MSGPPVPASPRQVVFGPFVFDETSGELRKHGIRIRLQGQPLQILCTLIQQPGRTVSRDEFHQQLWKGSTFVDFEHGLNAAMNRLRQVLGDSADQPRYVETLPGRGYRFISAVQVNDPKAVLVRTPPSEMHSERPRAGNKWRSGLIAAGILVALGVAYVGFQWRSSSSAPLTLRFSIAPPTGFSFYAGGSGQTAALSPDGTHLAFTAMDKDGVFQLFVRDLNGLDSLPLANSSGANHAVWAPDGHSLFLSMRGTVRQTEMDGDFHRVCSTPVFMYSGALLGSDLLISARSASYVVPPSGGVPRRLSDFYPWPEVLPDGSHLLYTVLDVKSGHYRVRVARFGEAGTAKDVVETDSRAVYARSMVTPATGYLLYVRGGNILAHRFDPRSLSVEGEPVTVVSQAFSYLPLGAADFSVSTNGLLAYRRYASRSQLAWVTRSGEVVQAVGPANVNVKQGRLSPDGTKIAAPIFDVNRGVDDLWIIDTETGASRRAFLDTGSVDSPVWAPDSKTLTFSREYDQGPKLFLRKIGETASEQLPPDSFQVAADWSRDGRFIAFTNTTLSPAENELSGGVYLIDMARSRYVVDLIKTPFHVADPAFSPDGRWLAFTSNESGQTHVYVQAFEAGDSPRLVGDRYLVSQDGAIAIRWRRDGKELFYLGGDARLHAVPVTLSPKVKIGEPVALFAIGTEVRTSMRALLGFDVSLEGHRFLVPIVTSPQKGEIIVIQNWEATVLRKQRGS